jgi:antitoxin HicB
MDNFEYPVSLEKAAEGGYVVTFPDVPEAITQGEDAAEALVRARDALETALEFYTDKGEKLPVPSKAKRGQHVVRPAALFCMKLAIDFSIFTTSHGWVKLRRLSVRSIEKCRLAWK